MLHDCVPHGPVSCNRCWQGVPKAEQEAGPFRLVRDAGHWGSSSPAVLVLGVSKGNTQSRAFASGSFEAVAFKGIRPRLLEVLQTVGLLRSETLARFELRFCAQETEYAFASVVRCSLTGMDKKKGIHTADSPNVMPAFVPGSAGYRFVSACIDQHIGQMAKTTRTVVLLGNTGSYITNLRTLLGRTFGRIVPINDVAYRFKDILFVHVAHPSKGNGHFGAFNRGEGTAGAKMRLARQALQEWSAEAAIGSALRGKG